MHSVIGALAASTLQLKIDNNPAETAQDKAAAPTDALIAFLFLTVFFADAIVSTTSLCDEDWQCFALACPLFGCSCLGRRTPYGFVPAPTLKPGRQVAQGSSGPLPAASGGAACARR